MDTPFSAASLKFVETELIGEWFTEKLTADEFHSHRIKKVLVQEKTAFQDVILADTCSFGRCLILDGEIQSTQFDEFIYHECLVHPAMVLHPKPEDVLILGGGEGATVREILRHPAVKRVTMVDIDGEVVEFCKEYLAEWHRGVFAHAKTKLVIQDARKFVQESTQQFDIIMSDLPTPNVGSPVAQLYTAEFLRQLISRLRPGGIYVAQAGSGSLLQAHFHALLYSTLRKVFKIVRPYYAFVPSFDVPWAFLIATRKSDPQKLSAARIDRRLGTIRRHLRFYDGEAHEGLFRIPKYLRVLLAGERHVMTNKELA